MKNTKPKPIPEPNAQTIRNMWSKVEVPSGCWIWKGFIHPEGYPGNISVLSDRNGRYFYRPQRLFFSWFKYQIPDNFTVDHLCKNKACVNPDHMEAVSGGENASRANKRKYCKYGHPLVEPNLYFYKRNGKTARRCLTCILREREKHKNVK